MPPIMNAGFSRLSVRAGDDEIAPSAQEKIPQRLGHGLVGEPAVQHFLELRIAASDCVADDDKIRVAGDVCCAVAFHQRDAALAEKIRHRREHFFVRAGHREALLLHGRRDRAHRRAADAEKVDVTDGLDHFLQGRGR